MPTDHAARADRVEIGAFMLARSRELRLPDGTSITTPILVPSVSSKGFGIRPDGLSQAASCLDIVAKSESEALLVSAYDLHHRLLPDVDTLLGPSWRDTVYNVTPLLVLDSGGFELGDAGDDDALYRYPHVPRTFTPGAYDMLLEQMPEARNTLVVTYDHRTEETPRTRVQAAEGIEFKQKHPSFMVDLLLKPSHGTYLNVAEIHEDATALALFDVIGVTATELGDSLLERGRAVRELRSILDAAGIEAPIHVFGVLDPILVSYYFMAGAEVFDGLTWIRYGAHAGLSVYRDSAAVLLARLSLESVVRTAVAQLEFLAALVVLKRRLRTWARDGDFSVFLDHAEPLRCAHAAVSS